MQSNGTGKGQPFDGPASEMKESDWLSVEDLQASGRPHIDVTIERVLLHKNVQFEAGRTEAKKYAIAFKGAGKQLLINATNRKRLVGLFGGNTKDWIGKRIRLHLEEDRLPTKRGEPAKRGPCTRIIEAAQQQQKQAAPPPQQQPRQPDPEPEEQPQLDGMPDTDDWTAGLDDEQ